MKRTELLHYLKEYLDYENCEDIAYNGLQIEGKDEINKIALAVDASYPSIQEAVEKGADALIVHHGLFWPKPMPITASTKDKVETALNNNLNLFAFHIPLDKHNEVGNNVQLFKILNIENQEAS